MRLFLSLSIFPLVLLSGLATTFAADEPAAGWTSLLADIDPAQAGRAGSWTKADAGFAVTAAPSARLQLPEITAAEYDLRVAFTRRTGRDSIAVLFPHGTGQAALEVDAWGQSLAGIQNIAGRDIRSNPSRHNDVELTNGRRYVLTLEVRRTGVRGLLNDKVVATYTGDGADLALSNFWPLASKKHAGIGAWESATTFHSVELRVIGASATTASAPATKPSATTPSVATVAPANPQAAPMPAPRASATGRVPATGRAPAVARNTPRSNVATKPAGGKKRVLIVVANHHFFYREYADPRTALEAAGVEVTVAAGRKATCRPHPNSGQSNSTPNNGAIEPDLALADVKSADYDAIVFSGGWGASAYQFASPVAYDDQQYNGDPQTKQTVNRLIGEFSAQKKYLCGICNGVSVLAWARVGEASPLYQKNVCAPPGPAAPGVYNGTRGQFTSRWHPEANGAVIAPAGSIGTPGNTADDVMVDGRIITAEDDYSAREAGRRLAQLLGG